VVLYTFVYIYICICIHAYIYTCVNIYIYLCKSLRKRYQNLDAIIMYASHCATLSLQITATRCNSLQLTATHRNSHTAPYCHKQHHTTAHWNTLQHTRGERYTNAYTITMQAFKHVALSLQLLLTHCCTLHTETQTAAHCNTPEVKGTKTRTQS